MIVGWLAVLNVIWQVLFPLLPALSIVTTGLVLMYLHYSLTQRYMDHSRKRSLVQAIGLLMAGLLTGFLSVVALPVADAMRDQILKIGGLVITGVVAFSSTSLIRDAAAGIALQVTTSYGRGDYIKTGDYFGRITEIGIFHTEIQTHERSLVHLANSRLMGEEFETFPASGPLLTVDVSLGYDNVRQDVEEALREAALVAGLSDPFVHIDALDDFTVQYAVSGVLKEGEELLSRRSDFRKVVMDTLHEHGIEILSPNYQTLRDTTQAGPAVPEVRRYETGDDTDVEDVVFDKAIEAQELDQLDQLQDQLQERIDRLHERDMDDELREQQVKELEEKIQRIETEKSHKEEKLNGD